LIKEKPGKKVFSHAVNSKAIPSKKKKKNFDVVVVGGGQNSKKRPMQKAIHEGKFAGLSENVIRYRYGKLRMSKMTLFQIQANHPELAEALKEIPRSFAVPMAFGLYLSERAWHAIYKNHRRSSKRGYVENLLRRYAKRGRRLSPLAVEIMKITELVGGFVTYDFIFEALMVKSKLSRLAEEKAIEKEQAEIVECLKRNGDPINPSELEPVDVLTVHASCKSEILRGWKAKNRPPNRGMNFLWALCPKCKVVLSLSEKELRPQLTP
jgi:hypothetical protein